MKNSLLSNNRKNGESVGALLRHSSKAVCGLAEREVAVLPKNVLSAKARLSKAGYKVIGVGELEGKRRKVWFVPRGGFGSL